MTDVSDYRLEMENKLNELNRQIMECKIKVSILEEQRTREFYEHLEEFEAHQQEIKNKLQHLDELESGARAELKTYLDSKPQGES